MLKHNCNYKWQFSPNFPLTSLINENVNFATVLLSSHSIISTSNFERFLQIQIKETKVRLSFTVEMCIVFLCLVFCYLPLFVEQVFSC